MSNIKDCDPRAHYQGREIQLYGAQAEQFQGGSCYKQDFPAHPSQAFPRPPVTAEQRQWNGNSAPFEGSSCYKQDFTSHPIEPRPPAAGAQWQPNPAPFDGISAYRADFRGHPADPSQANRAADARPYQPSPAPFEGTSLYKQDFTQHLLERRQPHAAGAYQPNPAPFDGTSHYKADFKPHQIEPRGAGGPPMYGQPPVHTAPFEGQTLYKDDFKAYPMEPRPPLPPAQYHPNAAPFQGSTETRDQYQAWPADPAIAQRPAPLPPMRPSASFEGASIYRQDYKGWRLPVRRPALGVQMRGDRNFLLIPADAKLPASGKQIFTTVHDNQAEICVLVLRGDAPVASRNDVIGQFDLKGIPPGPRGTARIEISLHVDAHNIMSATAIDLDAQRHAQWLRQGSMEARTHSEDITNVL